MVEVNLRLSKEMIANMADTINVDTFQETVHRRALKYFSDQLFGRMQQ